MRTFQVASQVITYGHGPQLVRQDAMEHSLGSCAGEGAGCPGGSSGTVLARLAATLRVWTVGRGSEDAQDLVQSCLKHLICSRRPATVPAGLFSGARRASSEPTGTEQMKKSNAKAAKSEPRPRCPVCGVPYASQRESEGCPVCLLPQAMQPEATVEGDLAEESRFDRYEIVRRTICRAFSPKTKMAVIAASLSQPCHFRRANPKAVRATLYALRKGRRSPSRGQQESVFHYRPGARTGGGYPAAIIDPADVG